jgi:glycogen debranching enzyme
LSEVIEIDNQFYILAGSSLSDERTHVLKQGDTFGIFDHYGDIHPFKLGEQGIFHDGTRFLSVLDFKIENKRPLFLSSSAESSNEFLSVDLSNTDFRTDGELVVPRGTIYVARSKFLWQSSCYERLQITNFGLTGVELRLVFTFNADFVDIFEVRGSRRPARGERFAPRVEGEDTMVFAYRGLDNLIRQTRISFHANGLELSAGTAWVKLSLQPRQSEGVYFTIQCETNSEALVSHSYTTAFHTAEEELKSTFAGECDIRSSNELFDDWVKRSMMDLRMMVTQTTYGPYPYAGVPWFSTPFGRDGIITALETLWVNPSIARGVLAFLASVQASTSDARSESDPGKILHETRGGEMAALGEIPFGRYYGTVDATPLFIALAGAYYEQTGDLRFIEDIWPNIDLALEWIDRYGDCDGDLFVEYFRRSERGLLHQGWKDSQDSIMHADGRLAEGPIALCEVQAYVYAAKKSAARLSTARGDTNRAAELEQQAAGLREHFDRTFWCDDKSTYALALDGKKNPCRVRSSNPGHCLFAGIAPTEHAGLIAAGLMQETSFSGWGVRTLDSSEVRYNPMSYHNGSVWPHDNALIAYGLSAYGFKEHAARLLSSLFDLSQAVHLNRLPELLCGFARRTNQGPTLYPVACAPQAWAAGAVFMTVQACLGMQIDGPGRSVRFDHPILPSFINELRIRNLRVGVASLDLTFRRYPDNVGINVDRRSAPTEILVVQ